MYSTHHSNSGGLLTNDDQRQVNEKLNKILTHVALMKEQRDREEAAQRLRHATDKYGKDHMLPLINANDVKALKNGAAPREYHSTIVDQKESRTITGNNKALADLYYSMTKDGGGGGDGGGQGKRSGRGGQKQQQLDDIYGNSDSPRLTSSSMYGGNNDGNVNNNNIPSPLSSKSRPVKPIEATSLLIGEEENKNVIIPSPPAGVGSGRFTYSPRVQNPKILGIHTESYNMGSSSPASSSPQYSPRGIGMGGTAAGAVAGVGLERYSLAGPKPAVPSAPAASPRNYSNNSGRKESGTSKKKRNSSSSGGAAAVAAAAATNFRMGSPRNGFISKTTFSTAFDHCYQQTTEELLNGGQVPSPRQQLKQRAFDSRIPAPLSAAAASVADSPMSSSPTFSPTASNNNNKRNNFGASVNASNNNNIGYNVESHQDHLSQPYKALVSDAQRAKDAQEAHLEALRSHVIAQLRQHRSDEEVVANGMSARDYDYAQGVEASIPLESEKVVKRKRGIRVYDNDEYEVSPVSDLQYQNARNPKEGLVSRRKHIAGHSNLQLHTLAKKKNQIEDTSIFAPRNGNMRAGLAFIDTKGSSPRGVHGNSPRK